MAAKSTGHGSQTNPKKGSQMQAVRREHMSADDITVHVVELRARANQLEAFAKEVAALGSKKTVEVDGATKIKRAVEELVAFVTNVGQAVLKAQLKK